MIQRIQSIFLFLAAAAVGCLFFKNVAFGDFTEPNQTLPASMDGYFNIYDNTTLLVMAGVAAFEAFIAIFFFKNRSLQVNIVGGMIFSLIILIGLAFWQFKEQSNQALSAAYKGNFNVSLTGFIPLVLAFILAILAIRAIKKDEKLVRSADRLRWNRPLSILKILIKF